MSTRNSHGTRNANDSSSVRDTCSGRDTRYALGARKASGTTATVGIVATLAAAAIVVGCSGVPAEPTASEPSAKPAAAPQGTAEGANWTSYGGTYREDHYSPLTEINAGNIGRLNLAWYFDMPVSQSGVSGPLAVDGVLYFAVGLSVIHAMEATTGKLLWQYDPEVYKVAGHKMRAGWGVRGIAYDKGRVFTATLDGRLIAIDARTGLPLWTAQTVDPADGRYITGPPYVMKDKVIIGHGGADYEPVRAYVTAYDAHTGKQAWRFYVVPGNPADGFENAAMEMAAKTWTGEWWKFGAGGTAWHAMAYDAEFNRVYIGTGNGAPWNQRIRSPGGGDNLFLASIVALDADTGEYVWHYQQNPGETWDYNATMDIELADLTIGGERVPVLMQAPKNGFFYVIDRRNGRLISAEKFAPVNWAERIDLATGRPVENPAARFTGGSAFLAFPSIWGAHGVEAMSYNPRTGLVYLPARNLGYVYTDPPDLATWSHRRGMFTNSGLGAPPASITIPPGEGWLAAWDPVKQKEAWRVPLTATHNGGTLTTAGNLVFQGLQSGELVAYAADTGRKLWAFDAQTGIMSHPISYLAGGKQYVTLQVGYRASGHRGPGEAWDYYQQKRRVLTFVLDGAAKLPPAQFEKRPLVDVPGFVVDADKVAVGRGIYGRNCGVCHGMGTYSGGAGPDLAKSAVAADLAGFTSVVRDGALRSRGMGSFENLTPAEIEGLYHYIRQAARDRLQAQK